jgi:type II secretory pathway pseudopilin PulG
VKRRTKFGFSLVEVTLALGIAAFCLIAVFGLMPIGVQTSRNATSQTAATNILAAAVADLRATPRAGTVSSQYGIAFGGCTPPSSAQLYFNSEGQVLTRCNCCDDTSDNSQGTNPRYRLGITYPTSTAGLSYLNLKVTWPGAATPANASGVVEMFAAFDRK